MNKMLLAMLYALMTIGTSCAADQAPPHDMKSCISQAPFGFPTKTVPDSVQICRTAYVLLHDNEAKIPVWTSFVETPEHATGCIPRSNAFAPDLSIPEGSRAELKDYAHSNYDTGHMVNDNLMSWNLTVEHESFILSNMVPQLAGFNRGIWKVLETAIMDWAVERNHSLLIYAGPIYDIAVDDRIGVDGVDVPSGFYKIVVDMTTHEVMAFVFPHAAVHGAQLSTFQTTVLDVSKKTGIKFPLPSDAILSSTVWAFSTKDGATTKKTVCSIH